MATEPAFMRVPPEVRMLIYEYLFEDAGNKRLKIRSASPGRERDAETGIRTRYYVLDRSLHRRCYKTTYQLETKTTSFCPALMRVNRQVYAETAWLIYGRHAFDFGSDIEAVEPFLSDLTPASRHLIGEISLYKRGPLPSYENDRSAWRSVCRCLQRNGAIRKLRLVVEGGRPNGTWEGPKEFSANDIKLLSEIQHESLDWVSELAKVRGIQELEVLPDVHYCPPPNSSSMLIFAAVSASIEKGLAEFLKTQLRLA